MRRRLTLSIVGVVAAALLVAGVGGVLVARQAARRAAQEELLRQASSIAAASEELRRPHIVVVLRQALRLEGIHVLRLTPAGVPVDPVPADLRASDLQHPTLRTGGAVAGTRGRTVYAIAPVRAGPRPPLLVVLTRPVPSFGGSLGYVLLGSALALAAAAALAGVLARRITSPLLAAERATRAIAEGDLAARVEVDAAVDREVASLAASINRMAESLEQAKGLERQFLLSVSHDLRTPLTSIRGYGEAIADGTAPDKERAARVIAAEARRLERLVQDLLDLAKLDARRFSLDLRVVDAAEVVADVTAGFEPAAATERLALDVSVSDGLLVVADPQRLAQVVANLVENALKFAGARIEVRAWRDGGDVRLEVRDDGPGIPPADLPRVFERLYQSARTPARRVGSGLGLAIVHELVSAMGGRVVATSPPDGGTAVSVTLASSTSST